jgi:hypothetical protein
MRLRTGWIPVNAGTGLVRCHCNQCPNNPFYILFFLGYSLRCFSIMKTSDGGLGFYPRMSDIVMPLNKNFLQEKAVEATKQEKERKEEKT